MIINTSCIFLTFQTLTGRSNSNQTGYVGERVAIRCDALEGKTVRWRKNGAVLQTKTAGYGTGLLISTAQQSDEGIYTCDIINSTGAIQASYNVTLKVDGQSESYYMKSGDTSFYKSSLNNHEKHG